MQYVQIGSRRISRFILGSNPFSGFSHLGVDADQAMRRYYTVARIKETLRRAEALGVSTLIARADHHVVRMLLEYRDEGGKVDWLSQTCPELGPTETSVNRSIANGAIGVHVHGGVTDFMLAQGKLAEVQADIDKIRKAGLIAGIAGHNPKVFEFAEKHLDVDYYMCCYYNPSDRSKKADHVHGAQEKFVDEDRQTMIRLIATLKRPAIHYKILAAGRNDPREAFGTAAKAMRPGDAVCVGISGGEIPDMLEQDVALFNRCLALKGDGEAVAARS
jgi:hypothetical protein